jgi:hypothetical protein
MRTDTPYIPDVVLGKSSRVCDRGELSRNHVRCVGFVSRSVRRRMGLVTESVIPPSGVMARVLDRLGALGT